MRADATPEQLRAAWERIRFLPRARPWAEDFDQVMADPICSRLVRLEATHPAARACVPQRAPARPVQLPARPPQPLRFDHKRAAAGERDDD